MVAVQFLYQRDHALGLLQIRAELGLKGHVRQVSHPIFEFLALVRLPEKLRIIESRAQYALVAAANQAFRIGIGVHHRDELWRKLSVAVFHRKIPLVVPHHGDEHFCRQFEKLRIETALNRGRVLGQVDQSIEQPRVRLETHGANFLLNFFPALGCGQNHDCVLKLLFVFFDSDFNSCGPQNAMARSHIAGFHARNLERHHVTTQ